MIALNRILLVDDDTVTQMIHRRVIAKSGCALSVDVACDGQQALDLLHADLDSGRALPELVFLDVNMPCMGGFDFLDDYAKLGITPAEQWVILTLSSPLLPADDARAHSDACVNSVCDKPLRCDAVVVLAKAFRQQQHPRPAAVLPRIYPERSGAGPHQDRPSLPAGQGLPDWSRRAR